MIVSEIQQKLGRHYLDKGHICICPNFVGAGYQEMDLVTITKDHYVVEFEIKKSRADFKADMEKSQKHYMLSTGFVLGKSKIPSRFYYVSEKGIIKPNEVPEYAGHIEMSEKTIKVLKKAPKLHNEKMDGVLIDKLLRVFTERTLFGGKSKMSFEKNQGKKVYVKYKRKHHG